MTIFKTAKSQPANCINTNLPNNKTPKNTVSIYAFTISRYCLTELGTYTPTCLIFCLVSWIH